MLTALLSAALAAAASGSLVSPVERYVGSYPTDRVRGRSFVADPNVVRLVRAAVDDRFLARRVLAPEVSTPIESSGGLIVSGSCEAHNCPAKNWTIVVDPVRNVAAVCYHSWSLTGSEGRWFVRAEVVATSTEGCASHRDAVPAAVVAALSR